MLYIVVCFPWKQRPFAKKNILLPFKTTASLARTEEELVCQKQAVTALGSYRQANELNEHGTRNRFRSLGDPWEKATRYRRLQSITGDKTTKWKSLYGNQWITKEYKRSMIRKDSCLYPFFGLMSLHATWIHMEKRGDSKMTTSQTYHVIPCPWLPLSPLPRRVPSTSQGLPWRCSTQAAKLPLQRKIPQGRWLQGGYKLKQVRRRLG